MKSLRRFAPGGGRHAVEWVAGMAWTGRPGSRGLGGRDPWNTQTFLMQGKKTDAWPVAERYLAWAS